jgi:hypothetical protein
VRTLIFSGGSDLTDPWHPFAQSSEAVAEVLGGAVVTNLIDELLEGIAAGPDLLVINAGNAERPHPRDPELLAALLAHASAGRPLLVLHVAATLFPESPEWERLLGGRWVRGTTMHPEYGPASVEVVPGHPIADGLADFQLDDERYCWLRMDAGAHLLARHDFEGEQHPLAWSRSAGRAHVVYDALGHTAASFESAGHRRLLQNAAAWLTRD